MLTRSKLFEKLNSGEDGALQLSYEEACVVQKILLSNGYTVLMSDGDFEGQYKIQWIYAGDVGNLNYANSNRIVFASKDYLEMLEWGDYEEDDWEEE